MMTEKEFNKAWKDALKQKDKTLYLKEQKTNYGDNYNPMVEKKLDAIHYVAHIPFKDIIKQTGYTQTDFAIKYCIPLRTIESWCGETRKCNDYVKLLICKDLGLLN